MWRDVLVRCGDEKDSYMQSALENAIRLGLGEVLGVCQALGEVLDDGSGSRRANARCMQPAWHGWRHIQRVGDALGYE
jgi:hypothetical protein